VEMMVSPMWAAQSGRSFGPIIVGTKDSIDITDIYSVGSVISDGGHR
jgi:hypothetical protein